MPVIIEWILSKLPIAKILMVVAAIAALVSAYIWWEHKLKSDALLEYNKTQLEEVVKEQKALSQKMEQFSKDQAELLQKQLDYKTAVDQKFSNLGNYLTSPEARKADGPADDIMKRTIQEMQNARKK